MLRHVSDIRPERICATYGVVSPPAGGVGTCGSSPFCSFLSCPQGFMGK